MFGIQIPTVQTRKVTSCKPLLRYKIFPVFILKCYSHRPLTNFMPLSHFALLVVKQVEYIFKTKTGLSNQINPKGSKKERGGATVFPYTFDAKT